MFDSKIAILETLDKTQKNLDDLNKLKSQFTKYKDIVNLIKKIKKIELSPDLVYKQNEKNDHNNDFKNQLIEKVRRNIKSR